MKTCLICIAFCSLICGCAGPAPTQVRLSLISIPVTKTYVVIAAETNAVPAGSLSARGETDTQNVSPRLRGVVVAVDNQISFPNGGGTASSNDVPVSFSFSKQ